MEILLFIAFIWFIGGCLRQSGDSKSRAWDDPR